MADSSHKRKKKDKKSKDGAPSRKSALFVFGGILALGILLAGGRFAQFQIIEGARLTQEAEDQRRSQVETPAQRGTIFDRSGRVLAQSVRVYSAVSDSRNVETFFNEYVSTREQRDEPVLQSLDGLFEQLANYYADKFDVEPARMLARLTNTTAQGNLTRHAALSEQILPEVRQAIESDGRVNPDDSPEQRLFKRALRNVSWSADYMRVYPMGEVASQVIGFVNYDGVGVEGLERYYERVLRGTPGASIAERDEQGNIIPAGAQKTIPVQRGSDIMLTIDAEISHLAQLELQAAVERTQASAASAVVMNPRNGEIYAAVSYPTFDPNDRSNLQQENVRTRAIDQMLEPGSTFKPLTFAAAFDAGTLALSDTFFVPNSLRVGTRVISDSEVRPDETMDVTRIMAISSNVGTTRIAQQLGGRNFYDYLVRFGITHRPDVDFPGAAPGIVSSPDQWNDASLSNFSFGQGLKMSPLQLASAISAIANDGMLMTPHLLSTVPDGSFERDNDEGLQVVSPQAAHLTTQTLKAVMTDGTGRNVQVPGFEVAGKTGTAQKAIEGRLGYVPGLYISSFIGYLPADDPELLISIFVDEPRTAHFGSEVAGPPFANIATFSVRQLGLMPQTP